MESRRESTGGKRPRSPSSADYPQIASKAPKTHSNHLQINYLARQYSDNLPLVSTDDTLPSILRLMGDYDGVLHRHESIAGNLGACPLGPILVKRFERLFDAPPKVLKSNGKDGNSVSWLDVVEFAKSKPEQFTLEKTRNGVRVCQIYIKQSRVEITEEDYVLIASGMPQKMIPPQPISEDEEKELGALEILEKNLGHIIQLADQVAARASQLNHRLKNRRNAIVTRRENDATLGSHPQRSISPWRDTNGQGTGLNHPGNGHSRPHSPTSGFVAVNSRPDTYEENLVSGAHFKFSQPITDNVTIINGTSIKGASPSTRAELMKKFFTTSDRRMYGTDDEAAAAAAQQPGERLSARSKHRASDPGEYIGPYAPVAIPSTPSSLLPPPKSTTHHYERDDGGPFKIEMVSRMEDLQRGERILPPCDRCRRLHMDCLKNLTACMGCTKKHAKCSWKDVKLEELREPYPSNLRNDPENNHNNDNNINDNNNNNGNNNNNTIPHTDAGTAVSAPSNSEPPPPSTIPNVEGPAPVIRPASEPHQARNNSLPNRSLSENVVTSAGTIINHNTESPRVNGNKGRNLQEDQDATETLAQAIMDTVEYQRARAAAEAERDNSRKPES